MITEQSWIGRTYKPQTFIVSEEAVRRFLEALDIVPIEPVLFAPPTFPTIFSSDGPWLDWAQFTTQEYNQIFLVAEEYTYSRALKIGESVTCVTSINDVAHNGNTQMFVVTKTIGTDHLQMHVFTSQSTILLRNTIQ